MLLLLLQLLLYHYLLLQIYTPLLHAWTIARADRRRVIEVSPAYTSYCCTFNSSKLSEDVKRIQVVRTLYRFVSFIFISFSSNLLLKSKVKWLEGYPQHWRAGEESPHLQRIFHLPEQTCWSYTTSVLCLYSFSQKTYWPTAISHIGRQGRVADIS